MAQTSIRRTLRHRRLYATFLLGSLIGALSFFLLHGMEIEKLRTEIGTTYYALNQQAKEIHRLQEENIRLTKRGAAKQRAEEIIRDIEVEFLPPANTSPEGESSEDVRGNRPGPPQGETFRDKVIQGEGDPTIQTALERSLTPLIGKSTRWVSQYPELIDLILRNHLLTLDELSPTKVRAKLRYATFYQSSLRIWVSIEEIRSAPGQRT